MKSNARQKLLDAAAELFYAHGIHATGIDMIIAKAGVAKMSLYNNFASKAELVAAFIQARHQEWLDLYSHRLANAHDPEARVIAIFDAYSDHAEFAYTHGFRGCGLLNAAAELPVGESGRIAVRGHKEEVEQYLAQHIRDFLAQRHTIRSETDRQAAITATAQHLSFLLEGSITRAGLEGNSLRIEQAKQLAKNILAAL
jgi:AcrR family transcriptional regulator